MDFEDGVPCQHKGCLSHVTHPCEGCGRVAGRGVVNVIRRNLMTEKGYTPYCGGSCRMMPRTKFNGDQFCCPDCGWCSTFPKQFIEEYKDRWKER